LLRPSGDAILSGVCETVRRGPLASAISALLVQGACTAGALEVKVDPSPPVVRPKASVASNILRGDYVGSPACADCHPDIFDRWSRSPMHRMTRSSQGAEIRAPFSGSVAFKEDRAELEERGGARFMRIVSRFGSQLYRVTRVIGGRYREDFAGIEVGRPDPEAPPLGAPTDELILPLTWVYETQSFRLKGYSVMVGERPGLKAGGVWNRTCILCHNTAPYLTSLLGALSPPGEKVSYQGAIVDDLLPEDRRARFEIVDLRAADRALAEEIAFLGGGSEIRRDRSLVASAIRATRTRLGARHLVELGIGCEACHGGCREHAEDPRRLPSFLPASPFLRMRSANDEEPTRAETMNRACARCHQILFSRYPYTWEGGERRHDPGGSTISSGEARDLLLGGCKGALTCTMCHDPHAEDDPRALARLETPEGNGVCTGCHPALASARALEEHSHHDPKREGGSCISCHMPKKNMGLGYALTRYHRIGRPNDPSRVENDRPLECALCHAEATARDLLAAMERFWGRAYEASKLRALYGDLSEPVLLTTLERGKPHEQAAAIGVLQAHRVEAAIPLLKGALAHRYPLIRYYAKRALERTIGRTISIDVGQEAAEIRRESAELSLP
jgi:predicted CXXCH cytochrome family protein